MNIQIEILKALSDINRLRTIYLLLNSQNKLCVCEITDSLLLPQYTVSKILGSFKKLELVTSEKNGMWIYYKLNQTEDNKKLFRFLKDYVYKENHKDDLCRLKKRLSFRQCGKCVVTEIPNNYKGK